MKSKIFKTILVIISLVFLTYLSTFIDYSASQEYSSIAAQQANNDDAYYLLKTKETTYGFIRLIIIGLWLSSLYLFYKIWK